MKKNILEINVNCPVQELFSFTVDPRNTPKWIESIAEENTNEFPIKIGTLYRNHAGDNNWTEYVVMEYIPNVRFTLNDKKTGYWVCYDYEELSPTQSKLTYTEWMETGDLAAPFNQQPLLRLKSFLESTLSHQG